MIILAAVWLYLITHIYIVYGTLITVNNNGSDNDNCCVNGTCPCSSLSSALHNVSDNTVINITSESVTLHDIVGMRSGNLNNITISGNGATIMCNNTGGVYCESCNNITIMGIIWYQCGCNGSKHIPTGTQTPVLNFHTVSNMIISSCTFQSSSGCPVYINFAAENITINDSYFMNTIFNSSRGGSNCGGLYINSDTSDLNISVISSKFSTSGCRLSQIFNHYGVFINLQDYCELENINVEDTEFSNNFGGLYIHTACTKSAVLQLSKVDVYNNTAYGILISAIHSATSRDFFFASVHIDISFVSFMNNVNPLSIFTPSYAKELKIIISINNSIINNNIAHDVNILHQYATKLGTLRITLTSSVSSITVTNCYFYNNFNRAIDIHLVLPPSESGSSDATIKFTNVAVSNTVTTNGSSYDSIASVSIVTVNIIIAHSNFTNVSFISNKYSRYSGEVLRVENRVNCEKSFGVFMGLMDCTFESNTAFDRVVFLNINTDGNDDTKGIYNIEISNCNFNNNFGGKSIVCIQGLTSNSDNVNLLMKLNSSTFTNNKGSALYSAVSKFVFINVILFANNTANSGGAIYFEEVHSISSDKANVRFINNSAIQKGGALYFNLVTTYCNVFSIPFNATFINNSANIAGNSIYFSIPHLCHINTNTNDHSSLLHVPSKFKYSQAFYIRGSPIVTSPYSIKLYPPANATNNVSNNYSIQEPIMLGEPIQVNASVLDYFNNITEPVIFSIDCKTCGDDYALSTHQITAYNYSLNEFKVTSKISSGVLNKINISIYIVLQSVLPPNYRSISALLSIDLSSCHTGYLFSSTQRQCICYPQPDIVQCTEQYAEIKIGYWVGFLREKRYNVYTSAICPTDYCNFKSRKETSLGYYCLPRQSDNQCNLHRTGVACGECKSGYTLAYDSPDCINTDKCSAGMTILVIVLTILYWIAIVAVVFGLMYFQFQISSGYAYGIIYYYSIVDILLGSNISEDVFQFVAVLSSFAKLTPQLFGRLCLVEGLSGIDQQFIHYSHALAVSLILLVIVLLARYSPRFAVFVRRCIICIICLLLLLSYTSLASTSLQLLRPLTFNDVDEVCTYSSPRIKYFTGRHLVYAIVAILCEVIIVIGLPLFLLLEPVLGRRFNFVKIKPLLDQFQGCYKDKYRYFAVYYLLCRQVIILIVYVGNGDYYNKLYYLQTACIIIAMIHGWVQPYKKKLVNGLDGAILLTLVLVVNLNTFSFLSSVSSELSVVLIILPLLLLSSIVIRKLIIRCYNKKKKSFYLYNPVDINGEFEQDEDNGGDGSDDNEANNIRFVTV